MGLVQAEPRVVVRLAGGLGNQLFMYAAARRMALVHGVPLALDVRSGFRRDTYQRSYGLGPFAVEAPAASAFRSYDEPISGRPRELAQLTRLRFGLGPGSWVVDPTSEFDPAILDLAIGRGRYLRGYFQSERYFTDVADTVRADLTPTAPLSPASAAVASAIDAAGPRAVALHGRVLYHLPQIDDRADLPAVAEITRDTTGSGTGVLQGRDYYGRAAAIVAEVTGDPHFFVFGDHPEAIAAGIDLPGTTTVVGHNSHGQAHEDLLLMARCRHHVICGSTLGWWAAWLGERPDQVVVAPDRGYPNRDTVPDRWKTIPATDLAQA